MELTEHEKQIMVSVLSTLIYNSVDDLRKKLISVKESLSKEKYDLMVFGDEDLFSADAVIAHKDKYKRVSFLDGRWCLQTQLFYGVHKTKRVTQEQYNEMLTI